MIAIDAGTYMSGVLNALRSPVPSSASPAAAQQATTHQFLGTGTMPYASPLSNAAYVIRDLVSAVCITHAHLDHISGFVLNSACFSMANPKVLAGAPVVIDNILKHIFNNIIWPNLSNEGDDPIGLITLRRLQCGSEEPPSVATTGDDDDDDDDDDMHAIRPIEDSGEDEEKYEKIANGLEIRAFPVSHGCVHSHSHHTVPYDSTAFFVRDISSGKEILIFGDVEPDSISISPRNRAVWIAAARKFGRNKLSAIFIECSYASIQPEHSLFGHLSPPYLIQELKMFASLLQCPMPSELVAAEADIPITTTVEGPPSPMAAVSEMGVQSGTNTTYTVDWPVPEFANSPDSTTAGTNSQTPFPISLQQQLLIQMQQQQLQVVHHHPYVLHPHPHYHHHSLHKYMQPYSPSSSRRASAASVGSAGSGGSALSSPALLGASVDEVPVLYVQQLLPPTAQQTQVVSMRRTSVLNNYSQTQQGLPTASSVHYPSSQASTASVQTLGPLAGLVIVITHVKGLTDDEELASATPKPPNSSPPAETIILSELEELLANEEDLAGLRFVMAKTGQSLVI
ncbi:cAMP phosphodiesterases class-II-domain-containing protein [Limtongia smithiae]|uniref:cAMP phosphodiesterases class-II-domain-containing protein n=1 Tax=Limtongia smithiae TaxID=1125753 RepID=UPI0034CDD79D